MNLTLETGSTKVHADLPVVSVVIPSYGSGAHIAECLSALANQIGEPPFEVIVVDSGSDSTRDIVRTEFPKVRLIEHPERIPAGTARNLGVHHARGGIILFTDADCVPSERWIATLSHILGSTDALVVGGALTNGTPASATGSVGFYLEFFRFLGHRGVPKPVHFLVTANMGLAKGLVERQQFADESLGEDMVFTWQIAKAHPGKVLFVPGAEVRHSNRTGLRNLLQYQRRIGRAAVRYREAIEPERIRFLRRAPWLSLFLPLCILPWVGLEVAKRGSLADLARYICLLPLTLVANLHWLRGFREELKQDKVV